MTVANFVVIFSPASFKTTSCYLVFFFLFVSLSHPPSLYQLKTNFFLNWFLYLSHVSPVVWWMKPSLHLSQRSVITSSPTTTTTARLNCRTHVRIFNLGGGFSFWWSCIELAWYPHVVAGEMIMLPKKPGLLTSRVDAEFWWWRPLHQELSHTKVGFMYTFWYSLFCLPVPF